MILKLYLNKKRSPVATSRIVKRRPIFHISQTFDVAVMPDIDLRNWTCPRVSCIAFKKTEISPNKKEKVDKRVKYTQECFKIQILILLI